MLATVLASLRAGALRDLLTRVAWTFLYVFLAALVAEAAAAGSITDLGSTEFIRAAVIAAGLSAVKTIIAGQIGDPLAIKTNLSDFGRRLVHTFWQSLVAALFTFGFGADRATLITVVGAVLLNTLKGAVFPPLPEATPDYATPLNAHEITDDEVPAEDLPDFDASDDDPLLDGDDPGDSALPVEDEYQPEHLADEPLTEEPAAEDVAVEESADIAPEEH